MTEFTEKDLDRPWSSEEVSALSEGDLTKLAFLRDYKHFVFFLPAVFVLYLVGGSFGVFGKVIGWIGVVMFGVFALQGIFNTGVVFISLVGTPFHDKAAPVRNTFWKSLQFLISFGNFPIYATLPFIVYAEMCDLKLQEYIPW